MALSAGANITGLNHTLQQLITLYTSWKSQSKYPKQRFKLFTLITGTEQHEKNANYWYRTIIIGTEQQEKTAQFVLV